MIRGVMVLLFLLAFACVVTAKKVGSSKRKSATKNVDALSDSSQNVNEHFYTIQHLVDSMSRALNCKIKVKEAPIATTLNARPAFLSLFGKRKNRVYIIRINNRENFKGIYNHEVPPLAQQGLWFHELMHIKDYQSRSIWGIMYRGVQYLTYNGRKIFEHEIDHMVVMHGYGEALYNWANYIMFESPASEAYKAYKQAVYLTPAQIKVEMGQNIN
jgi:hypothetical protein